MMGTYALNRTETSKLLLQIMLVGVVAQTRNNHGLKRITTDVCIVTGFVCEEETVSQ